MHQTTDSSCKTKPACFLYTSPLAENKRLYIALAWRTSISCLLYAKLLWGFWPVVCCLYVKNRFVLLPDLYSSCFLPVSVQVPGFPVCEPLKPMKKGDIQDEQNSKIHFRSWTTHLGFSSPRTVPLALSCRVETMQVSTCGVQNGSAMQNEKMESPADGKAGTVKDPQLNGYQDGGALQGASGLVFAF